MTPAKARLLPFHHNMCCLFTGDGVNRCDPESVEIEAGKEMLPFAQEHRRKRVNRTATDAQVFPATHPRFPPRLGQDGREDIGLSNPWVHASIGS